MSFSDGPRPWPLSRWQVLHARSLEQPGAALRQRALSPPPCSHAWYCAGSSTVTLPIMPEWLVPQYSAQKMWYVPGLVRLEPQLGVAPGNRVDLGAERREVQAVQHVLGADRDLDRPARRDVQLVDLALAFEVLELPHPLLADGVDVHRLVGRTAQVVEDRRAPAEHHHRDEVGMTLHSSSSGRLPSMRAPISPSCVGGTDAEEMTSDRHGQREERATARMKKYSASTSSRTSTPARGRAGCRI